MNLKSLYNLYASHPEGRWITHPQNTRELFRFIKEHPVKNILELGTGIGGSTAAMAYALHEKGEGGMIHTVEQTEKCYKLAQELLPEELKPYVTFYRSDPKVWTTEHVPYQHFSVFEILPETPEDGWDLILVDGPGPWVIDDRFIDLPNGDVLKLLIENTIRPGTHIAWDGRMQALTILEQHFGSNFYLAQVGPGRFNVLERKDNALHHEDVRLEEMKKVGYV